MSATETPNLLKSLDYSVLQQCMHCGMCLPSCPTYAETGKERNSPRGRIALMRAVADEELPVTRAFGEEMYHCLGCLACTTACPAGVNYSELIETARAEVERVGILASPTRNAMRAMMLDGLFMRPRLLRLAGRMLWILQASGIIKAARKTKLTALLPARMRSLEMQTPVIRRHFSNGLISFVEAPVNRRKHRVAMLTGCIQDMVFSDINRATVDVLVENGCEVLTPPAQPCCGALHSHNGKMDAARELARRQIDLIDPLSVDAIISNAGGCGSHLRSYGHLLEDDPAYAARAKAWSSKLRDIHEWLVEIGFRKPANHDAPATTVTYHESCHLCHGQKVSRQPRDILESIPGVELRECPEATWCCGSAGIYNLTHPDTSDWLQERKLGNLASTGADVVATANPGCHLQIQNGLAARGDVKTGVSHPIVLLAQAYAAERLQTV
ncbi:MAG TPA: heterodisulfide reductase-related iron-sulfur binding cluster [Rariglobus sp.]|jgi:glycolate oxidase iron-sulfur subunit|nr:heterodisulfide reductase-related iron-sulfur binding cluster [Rariglobus sp.]